MTQTQRYSSKFLEILTTLNTNKFFITAFVRYFHSFTKLSKLMKRGIYENTESLWVPNVLALDSNALFLPFKIFWVIKILLFRETNEMEKMHCKLEESLELKDEIFRREVLFINCDGCFDVSFVTFIFGKVRRREIWECFWWLRTEIREATEGLNTQGRGDET